VVSETSLPAVVIFDAPPTATATALDASQRTITESFFSETLEEVDSIPPPPTIFEAMFGSTMTTAFTTSATSTTHSSTTLKPTINSIPVPTNSSNLATIEPIALKPIASLTSSSVTPTPTIESTPATIVIPSLPKVSAVKAATLKPAASTSTITHTLAASTPASSATTKKRTRNEEKKEEKKEIDTETMQEIVAVYHFWLHNFCVKYI
jgi:hypothetical protein